MKASMIKTRPEIACVGMTYLSYQGSDINQTLWPIQSPVTCPVPLLYPPSSQNLLPVLCDSQPAFIRPSQNVRTDDTLHSTGRRFTIYSIRFIIPWHGRIILHAVWHGSKASSLTLRIKHTQKVFENRALRMISGPQTDEVTGDRLKLHNEKLHDL